MTKRFEKILRLQPNDVKRIPMQNNPFKNLNAAMFFRFYRLKLLPNCNEHFLQFSFIKNNVTFLFFKAMSLYGYVRKSRDG